MTANGLILAVGQLPQLGDVIAPHDGRTVDAYEHRRIELPGDLADADTDQVRRSRWLGRVQAHVAAVRFDPVDVGDENEERALPHSHGKADVMVLHMLAHRLRQESIRMMERPRQAALRRSRRRGQVVRACATMRHGTPARLYVLAKRVADQAITALAYSPGGTPTHLRKCRVRWL